MKTFSIIVLCYNSNEQSLISTLNSIIIQKNCDFEIILADDASKNNCLIIAEEFLKQKKFYEYKILSHKKNVGTVQNIYDALKLADSTYVKCIGAGDLLYKESTLSDITNFMNVEQCVLAYGKMQAYHYENGKPVYSILTIPLDIIAHEKNNIKKIKKNIIQNHGMISGASMFFKTKTFKKYLQELLGTVRYCEDWVQVHILMNNEKISFFPDGVVYYEIGSGISTNAGNGNSDRIRNDHHNFWNLLIKKYSDNKLIQRGKTMYEITYVSFFPKKMAVIIFKNISYLLMLLRTKFQRKHYVIKDKGILK